MSGKVEDFPTQPNAERSDQERLGYSQSVGPPSLCTALPEGKKDGAPSTPDRHGWFIPRKKPQISSAQSRGTVDQDLAERNEANRQDRLGRLCPEPFAYPRLVSHGKSVRHSGGFSGEIV